MGHTKLPYEFDLLHDIKTVEELHRVLNGEPHCTDAKPWELEELCEQFSIPLPEGYSKHLKKGFPTTVWIDDNGCYQDWAPTVEEAHRFQRMRKY